ncbi:hypothetical protein [Kineosporia babensis]|uniref:Uncharacterized protein n=1 Tax=Kineosporia babensis TaxID=499548 RepID=A0A9X1NC97_9ACTN|nr:hypothetical protein [Kineosporia babensis]MCD5311116.1 hypothetical protein [Kineosporia babensis]
MPSARNGLRDSRDGDVAPGRQQRPAPADPAGSAWFGRALGIQDAAQYIAERLGLGPVQPWNLEEAGQAWGEGFARFALGSNSRVRATRARDLGWSPTRTSITAWICDEMKIG